MGANTRRAATNKSGQFILKRIASENISALKLLKSTGLNTCGVASSNGTFEDAQVLGIATNAGSIGDEIEIVIGGLFIDPVWNFNINGDLYLDALGNITDIAPSVGFRIKVGKAFSGTEVFIDITEIISLI